MKHLGDGYKLYKYTFPDGKIYIGITSLPLEQRRDNGYNHNAPLKKAMRSCGWKSIKKEILADKLSKEDAAKLEKETIALLNATDPQVGYNISKGGYSTFAGLKHTQDHKEYMSKLYKGKTYTEETLAKMKISHAKERKAVQSHDETGTICCYKSLGDAADDVGGYKTNISRACKEHKKYKDRTWRFVGGDVG